MILFFLSIGLGGTPLAFAQEAALPVKERFFNLGGGYTLPKFIDNSFSLARYQGHAVSAVGGFQFRKPARLHHLDFRFDYGEMSNASGFAVVDYFRFEGNYAYQKLIRSFWQDKIQWYAGGSLNTLWTLWIYNNYTNNAYDNSVYGSLSPQTSLVYHFTLFNRTFRAGFSAYLPVLTLAMRPTYGASSFAGFLDDDRDDTFRQLLESSQLASFNKFFRYSNTFSLEYPLRNANRLRLSYEWNILRYSEPRIVKAASHNITIATMFNF